MRRLAKTEAGFGLIELLIAMTVMVIAIMAIVAAFSSGMVALNRASQRIDRGHARRQADGDRASGKIETVLALDSRRRRTDRRALAAAADSTTTHGHVASRTATRPDGHGLPVQSCDRPDGASTGSTLRDMDASVGTLSPTADGPPLHRHGSARP